MLKKAGIVAATSVASLLALSPLAFAGDYGHVAGDAVGAGHDTDRGSEHGDDRGYDDRGHHHGSNQNSEGLVNALNGNNVNVPIQFCNNDIQGQVGLVTAQDIAENLNLPLNAAAGLLGAGAAQQHNDLDNSRVCGQETGGAGYGNG